MAIFIIVKSMFITSCGTGIDKRLMFQTTSFLSKLDPSTQAVYKTLGELFDEQKLHQLEAHCKRIHNVEALKSFIEKTYQIQKEYLTLTYLLPEKACNTLNKQIQSSNLNNIENIIQQNPYNTTLKLWHSLDKNIQEKYIQLIKASQYTKQSLNNIKVAFLNYTPELQKNIQKINDLINNQTKRSNPVSNAPHNTNANMCTQAPYIQQKEPLTLNHTEPQIEYKADLSKNFIDIYKKKKYDWLEKLNLNTAQEAEFCSIIEGLKPQYEKNLGALLNQTEQESINIFFKVYFQQGNFNQEEKIELLAALIYLYKTYPKIALKLCNDPCNLSPLDLVKIVRNTTSKQLSLLQRLNDLIEEL